MSYDIYLRDADGNGVQLPEPHQLNGGTYAMGGTREAWLNVTYNYSTYFHEHIDAEIGIRWLYGKKAADTIPTLEKAISALGTETADDYWARTPGNAGAALANLLELARLCPDAIWAGD